MATCFLALPYSVGSSFKLFDHGSTKFNLPQNNSLRLSRPRGSNRCMKPNQKFTIRAEYNDDGRGNTGDFVAGFLLGGAVFGTLAYIFAPQIRRSILNEDESGFRKARRPIYYDDGLEKTRQTLNAKLRQLNSAIDNVSSQLRGGNNVPKEPIEDMVAAADSEVEAAM
ncbi:uncharacterized protein LOC18437470 [Amborella trichopoda]|nr:uncharacterized protein LOC18437470 [Amborella trichopoda]|eukprot:XP_006847741.2 uncharacterized protein LOC18437470 [Amborella trichopoda]